MRRRSLRFVVGEEVGAGPFRPTVRAAAEARAGPPRRVFAGFPLSPSGWQREQGSGKKKELLSLCDARTRLVGTVKNDGGTAACVELFDYICMAILRPAILQGDQSE